jgi:hypothetical protein
MILLLIIPCWILVLVLVLAVCLAARGGDQQDERRAEEAAWDMRDETSVVYCEPPQRRDADSAQRLIGAGGTAG